MLLAQALLTALLSGLFSGAIIFALNERRERRELKLRKIEAAIEAYSDWAETVSEWPLAHFSMFIDDRAVGRKKVREVWEKSRSAYRRADVLLGIYMPECRPILANFALSYATFIPVSGRLGVASIAGELPSDDDKNAISPAGIAITQASHTALDALLQAAQRHSMAPHLVRLPFFGAK